MKIAAIIILFTITVSLSFADDIVLKDGRTLENAKVLRKQNGKLHIMHSEGILQVSRNNLPEDLAEQYYPAQRIAQQADTKKNNFTAESMIVKKIDRKGWLAAPYDYWFRITGSRQPFKGKLLVAFIDGRGKYDSKPTEYEFEILNGVGRSFSVSTHIAPYSTRINGDYGFKYAELELIGRDGASVFKDKIPITSKYEDTSSRY
jgi:hypothetical protein